MLPVFPVFIFASSLICNFSVRDRHYSSLLMLPEVCGAGLCNGPVSVRLSRHAAGLLLSAGACYRRRRRLPAGAGAQQQIRTASVEN